MRHTLINCDCLEYLGDSNCKWDTIFADPPDNIGTEYSNYKDSLSKSSYISLLRKWLKLFVVHAHCVWFSYNAKWTFHVGRIITEFEGHFGKSIEAKSCVQTFTFGQHNQHDLGNNHRPLLRLQWSGLPLFPDAIRVPSQRQKNGDKRADPRGRVPGDVFDFPRVTGNSRQRRRWHPTQLNEDLVERCIRLTTPPGGTVLDPFAGTGTTLRVCKKTGNPCTLSEVDLDYCYEIANEHKMSRVPFDRLLQSKPLLKWSLEQPQA